MSEAVRSRPRAPDFPQPPPPPVVAEGAGFSGLLQLRSTARIDGEVEGEIIAGEAVWIGESGRVHACVAAQEVVVAGELVGEIRASARVELRETARVTATLHTPCLVLADGAFFEGDCRAGPDSATPGPEIPPQANSGPQKP